MSLLLESVGLTVDKVLRCAAGMQEASSLTSKGYTQRSVYKNLDSHGFLKSGGSSKMKSHQA